MNKRFWIPFLFLAMLLAVMTIPSVAVVSSQTILSVTSSPTTEMVAVNSSSGSALVVAQAQKKEVGQVANISAQMMVSQSSTILLQGITATANEFGQIGVYAVLPYISTININGNTALRRDFIAIKGSIATLDAGSVVIIGDYTKAGVADGTSPIYSNEKLQWKSMVVADILSTYIGGAVTKAPIEVAKVAVKNSISSCGMIHGTMIFT